MKVQLPALLLLLGFFSQIAGAAQPSNPLRQKYALREFIASCKIAFGQSTQSDSDDISNQICRCTAQESKHQGVTPVELAQESAKIKKDPKYKIENKKLLSAFHICTIAAMQAFH